MGKPLPINFSKMVAAKPIQGDGPRAKPVSLHLMLRTDQLREPDTSDRTESLKTDWDEFLASIRSTASTSQQGAGNVTPIIVVGTQAPYEIVAGRRRYLACKELGLPIDAKVYPFLNEDDKACFKYSENFQRNNYTLSEIIENVKSEMAQGRGREWLSSAFGKTVRSIDAYIAIAKDAKLTEEVKLGLSRREATRLLQKFGENASVEAQKMRQDKEPEGGGAGKVQAKRRTAKNAGESEQEPLTAKVTPGVKVIVRFEEWKAGPKDFQAYGRLLDTERARIGALIGARSKRAQAEV